jgi:hypothetical protein
VDMVRLLYHTDRHLSQIRTQNNASINVHRQCQISEATVYVLEGQKKYKVLFVATMLRQYCTAVSLQRRSYRFCSPTADSNNPRFTQTMDVHSMLYTVSVCFRTGGLRFQKRFTSFRGITRIMLRCVPGALGLITIQN